MSWDYPLDSWLIVMICPLRCEPVSIPFSVIKCMALSGILSIRQLSSRRCLDVESLSILICSVHENENLKIELMVFCSVATNLGLGVMQMLSLLPSI